MNATTSAYGLALQEAKGTEQVTGGWHWFLATEQAAGAQPRIRQLPPEMGAGLISRGMVKTGVSNLGTLRLIPRPASLGLPLKGVMGACVSTLIDPDITPASGDEYYEHVFTIDTDPASVPWFTLRRSVSTSFGEIMTDMRVGAVSMDMSAINFVTGDLALQGITPKLEATISGWSPAPDTTPPFNACIGLAKIITGDDADSLPTRGANLTIANNLMVDENFVIGSYVPRNIDVTFRTVTVTFTVIVDNITKYQLLMYDTTGGGTAWLPVMYETTDVTHLTFKTAENMAGMTLNPIPYQLDVKFNKAHWVVEPIGMRAGENILMRVTGTAIQTAGVPITLTLKNQTADYVAATP